ncbi:murein biosynthesis integral membrane protein MurJ [Salininema proteolyticum]|uniref:Murein biosynthesis integral membrane protein MurJ n=1 Tax=Salininema proteolyticum TaxID=1607685 RepID=A0ABV8TZC6_9ACTN
MTDQPSRAEAPAPPGDRVGKSATLIGAITIGSRLAGFARMLVLGWGVGLAGMTAAYQNSNTIPNMIFELVAGGALAALVVPLLAAPIARRDRDEVSRLASTLLTWAVVVLVPLAVLVVVFARPLVVLVASDKMAPEVLDAATEMLAFFAPQLPLYGIAVVLTGVLQAHRRFAWPALAPLLSSLTMMAVYYAYGVVTDHADQPGEAGQVGIVLLGLGTTFGVLVLAGCLFFPLRGLHLRLRPSLRFDDHVTGAVKSLAIAGAITLGAQQVCQLVLMHLANRADEAGKGVVVVFTFSQTFFLLPWAVLAVPLATAAYPALSESAALGDRGRFATTTAKTTRSIVLLSGLGVAALAGLAQPISVVLTQIAAGDADDLAETAKAFTATLTGFSFGLVGYSLFAILSRALYAVGHPIRSSAATAVGWAAAIAAGLALSGAMPLEDRPLALSLGWSIGMTVMGVALLAVLVRACGRATLRKLPRALLSAGAATILSILAARYLLDLWGEPARATEALLKGFTGGLVILVVYGLVAAACDARDLRAVLRRRKNSTTSTAETTDRKERR